MTWRNIPLKVAAERYGGKSAAANLANFLARSNDELATMRTSTVRRVAGALDCPPEWILDYLGK